MFYTDSDQELYSSLHQTFYPASCRIVRSEFYSIFLFFLDHRAQVYALSLVSMAPLGITYLQVLVHRQCSAHTLLQLKRCSVPFVPGSHALIWMRAMIFPTVKPTPCSRPNRETFVFLLGIRVRHQTPISGRWGKVISLRFFLSNH